MSDVTPLGYAYEALLINEFHDPTGARPYSIQGSVSVIIISVCLCVFPGRRERVGFWLVVWFGLVWLVG